MSEQHRRAAKLGGSMTLAMYGTEHFRMAGAKGGAKTKGTRGPEFYKEIGKKGAATRATMLRNAALEEAAQIAEQHGQTAQAHSANATTAIIIAEWNGAAAWANAVASAIRSLKK